MPRASLDAELDALLSASETESRYVDLALRFRRPMAHFLVPVEKGARVSAAGVVLISQEAGVVVPVASEERGASNTVPHGAELLDDSGAVVGTYVPETIYQAGGRWDLLERRHSAHDPREWVNLDIQESQLEVARYLADFLRRFRAGAPRQHSVLMNYGPRRGGKTWILLAFLIAANLDNPGLITAAVSVSHVERMTDIDKNLRSMIPRAWWSYRAWPEHCFTFLNGSTLANISTKDKESTKRGRLDFYLLNEGAKMDQATFENCLGGTADREGLVMVASNPPTTLRGEWVQKQVQLWEAAQARKEHDYPIHVIRTGWKGNAAISHEARGRVARILRDLNERASDADDEGLMLPVTPRAFWDWKPEYSLPNLAGGRLIDLATRGDYQDITRAFTRKRWGAERDAIVGVDFQRSAGIVASFWRVYGSLERPVLLCFSDLTVNGSEHDFIDEIEDQDWGPLQLLFVGDSTGLTQDYEHAPGKTSYGPFLARGWKIVPPTVKMHAQSKAPKNPPVSRSLKECNRLIRERRIWCTQAAPNMLKALADCEQKQSKAGPYPCGPLAHQADGFRYVMWWVEPPAKKVETSQRSAAYAVPGF